jgi:glycosyltransferase involved in cell wall biosynthesis
VRRVDAVVGVHPDWQLNVPRAPRRFVSIPNIVEDLFFRIRRGPEPGLVLFAGGSRAIKGWTTLAAAWPAVVESVAEARLVFAGWPADAAPPDFSPAARGSVSVGTWLSSDDLAALMARASLLVIPSRYEVAPITLAEAWAVGLPVVATSVGGIPKLARDAAVLVDPDSPASLASGVVRALNRGDDIAAFVNEGRRRAEAHRAGVVAAAHADLYRELSGLSA